MSNSKLELKLKLILKLKYHWTRQLADARHKTLRHDQQSPSWPSWAPYSMDRRDPTLSLRRLLI